MAPAKRKPLSMPVPKEEPIYTCSTCNFYEPEDIDSGVCYGHSPQVLVTEEGNPQFIRVRVQPMDVGCAIWRARHSA